MKIKMLIISLCLLMNNAFGDIKYDECNKVLSDYIFNIGALISVTESSSLLDGGSETKNFNEMVLSFAKSGVVSLLLDEYETASKFLEYNIEKYPEVVIQIAREGYIKARQIFIRQIEEYRMYSRDKQRAYLIKASSHISNLQQSMKSFLNTCNYY